MSVSSRTFRLAFAAMLAWFSVAARVHAHEQADQSAAPAVERPSWEKIESEILPGRDQPDVDARDNSTVEPAAARTGLNKPIQNRDREKQPIQRGATSSATGGSWTRTFLSLLAVIGLVLLLAWGYRSAAMGANPLTQRGRSGGVIQVIGRQSISPRHAVCLVRVGPRLVLVGQSQDRLTQLDVIEDAALVSQLVGESSAAVGRRDAAVFQKQLENEAAAYGRPAPQAAMTPIQRALQRMQAALKQTVGSKAASES